MHARCPNCKTLFRVSVDQLELADGLVRCGQCLCIFRAGPQARPADGLLPGEDLSDQELAGPDRSDPAAAERALAGGAPLPVEEPPSGLSVETAPEDSAEADAGHPADPELPSLLAARSRPGGDQPARQDTDRTPQPDHDEDADAPALILHGLAAEHGRQRRPRWLAALLVLLNLALALLVLGQFAWHERERLARIEWVRPWVADGCRALGCEIPEPRDLDSIQLLDRSVSSHPSVEDALIITATMVNNADFRQPFPLLMVSMSDIRGQVVARRHFRPNDYLDAESGSEGMIPGAPVAVALEVTDPGGDALTFELEFF